MIIRAAIIISVLSVAAMCAAGPANAISRYNATGLDCEDVRARIASEGAAIMRYPSRRNRSLVLYDRYVANGNFCPTGHSVVEDHIPTADVAQCPVLRCQMVLRDRRDRRFLLFPSD